jgi:hypothetical protein
VQSLRMHGLAPPRGAGQGLVSPLEPLGRLLGWGVQNGIVQALICWLGAYSAACSCIGSIHAGRASRDYRRGWYVHGDVELATAELWMRRGLFVPAMVFTVRHALQLWHAIR